MADFNKIVQSADWKREKHVPVIQVPDKVKRGEFFEVKVTIGLEIGHPNTTEHHISWVEVFFQPEGEPFALTIGRAEFAAHGASTQGADTSTIYTHPEAAFHFKTDKPGTIQALSCCNIHGLWQNSQQVAVIQKIERLKR